MKKQCALFVALFLAFGNPMWSGSESVGFTAVAQTGKVRGVVKDASGEPLIGATVMIKGTSIGVSTDADGAFSINTEPGNTLVVSYVGYTTRELKAENGMNVILNSSSEALDELVVVGYGTQKKVNLTGAVATVDVAKQLEGRPQQDLAKALQGAVPGLTITSSNGNINGTPTMKIRGTGTLSNSESSDPLIVVDGVPMDDISFLNPEDIKDISVLKDAASSSIYGTRAAFGVILIQTKTAKAGDKVQVKYSNNFSWSQATYLPNYSSVPNQIRALVQANKRAGLESELFGMYLEDMLPYAEAWYEQNGGKKAKYREMRPFQSWDDVGDYWVDENGNNAMYYADWDVPGIFFNNAAPSQSHNVTLQGSSGKTLYYLGFGYNEREDIMEFSPEKVKRYNVNANIQTDITKWLIAGVRFNFTNKVYDQPNVRRTSFQYIWRWGSFFGPYGYMKDADGNIVDCENDIAYRKQAGNDHDVTTMTRMQAWARANIIKGLTLNADFTYDITNRNNEYAALPVIDWDTWGGNINNPFVAYGQGTTSQTQTNAKTDLWTMNVFGSYENTFADAHNLKVMLGATAEREQYRYFSANRKVLLDNNLPELNLASGAQTVNSEAYTRATAGFFSRINYDYKGIYLLELNGRYDGSSRFPANDQWAFFPSMSAGYRFSEEAYFESLRDYVSHGKLRFSYGEIGNEAIGNNMFLSTIDGMTSYWIDADGVKLPAYNMPSLVSSALSWERVRTIDAGIDLGFLNNSLNVGFDWYQRETHDMLAPGITLPNTVGASAPYVNAGSLRTRGWELSISWNKKFGDWNVYANANLADAKTVVTKWNNPSGILSSYFTGKEYGAIYGFETDRYFEESDFTGKNADGSWIYAQGVADQTGLQSGDFVYGPGDIKFKDLNGDGVIDGGKGTKDDMGDLKVIGNSTPRYEYSFRLGATWKGFDLDLYFQGVGKRDQWTVSAFVMPLMRGADATYANQESYNKMIFEGNEVVGYEINQNNKYPCLYPGNVSGGTVSGIATGKNNFYPQDKYLVNMSYLRMKNITFGYTLPQHITKKAYMDKVRVYFATENPFMIYRGNSDYPLDPEINTGQGSLNNGTWGRTNPVTRSYSCGLQVTF